MSPPNGDSASTAYAEVIARNIRAARGRVNVNQQVLAERMRALGFSAWLHQTVGNVERAKRRVTAEEVFALAIALETSVTRLVSPIREDKRIELPSGLALGVPAAEGYVTGERVTDERILWFGDKPLRNPPPGEHAPDDDDPGET